MAYSLGAVPDDQNQTLAASRAVGYPVIQSPFGPQVPLMWVPNPSTGQYAPIDAAAWGLSPIATVGYDQALGLLRELLRTVPREFGEVAEEPLKAAGIVSRRMSPREAGLWALAHGVDEAGVADYLGGGAARRTDEAARRELLAVAEQRGFSVDQLQQMRVEELRGLLCDGNFLTPCPYAEPFIPPMFGGEPAARAATAPITKSEVDSMRRAGVSEDAAKRIAAAVTMTAEQGGLTDAVREQIANATPEALEEWATGLPEVTPTIVRIDGQEVTDADRQNARIIAGHGRPAGTGERGGASASLPGGGFSPLVLLAGLGLFFGLRRRK